MVKKEIRHARLMEAGTHYNEAVDHLQKAEDVFEEKGIPRKSTVAGHQQEGLWSLSQALKLTISALAPEALLPTFVADEPGPDTDIKLTDDGIPLEPEHEGGPHPQMVHWEFYAQQVRDRDERIRFLEGKLKTTEEVHRTLVNDYHTQKRLADERQRTIEAKSALVDETREALRAMTEKHGSLERSITPITNQHNVDTQRIASLERTIAVRDKTIKDDTFRLRELDGYRVTLHSALGAMEQVAAVKAGEPIPDLVRAQIEIQADSLKKFEMLCRGANTSSSIESQYAPFAAMALNRLDRARFVALWYEMLTALQKLARGLDTPYATHDRYPIGPTLRQEIIGVVQRVSTEVVTSGETATQSWDGSLIVRQTSEAEAKRMALTGEPTNTLTLP